jgi:hypothetical protein
VQTEVVAKAAENLEDDSTVSYRIPLKTLTQASKDTRHLPKRKVTGLVMAAFAFCE